MNNITKKFALAHPSQNGFSMIEVLFALIILSVGLLGFAGLQLESLQASNDSYQRDRATHLANDIIHKLRANRTAALALQYDQPAAGSLTIQNISCQLAAGCPSAALAGDDLFNWAVAIGANLANGAGVVCIDSTPNDLVPTPSPANPLCDGLIAPGGAGPVYAVKIWWGNDNVTFIPGRPDQIAATKFGGGVNIGTNLAAGAAVNPVPDGIPDFTYVATHQP